ncbi:hypothetical protein QBC41DRAFT_223864 [Cercophora samala]|uniref:Uncharacterized protein n=1 Tax=Cercophora samala TaxID=330535 RepID=A0AA39ZEE2_9PEZI|nr:hypothetical protein QBC41DRAFT_223864 [Cercophora samala]
MEGIDSLGDYDVLVSYNQEALNTILLERLTEVGPITSKGLEWEENGTGKQSDTWGDPVTTTVKINLQKPALQISDGDGRIFFTASLSGSQTVRRADGKTHTEEFTHIKLVITTSLSSVHGTMNDAGDFTPHPSSTPASAGAVVVMEPNQQVTVGTCINFANLLSVDVDNDTDGSHSSDKLDQISALVKAKIERKFKDSGLQYSSLTASLLHTFTAGMKFTLNLPSYQVSAESVVEKGEGMGTKSELHMDGFSFNTDDSTSTLTLSPGRAASPFQLSYKSTTQTIGWSSVQYIPKMPPIRNSGQPKTNFLLSAAGSWTRGADEHNHPNEIRAVFTFDSAFKVEIDHPSYEGWKKVFFGRPFVPPQITNLRPAVPEISFPVAPLDYFLTTNLLFPGDHIFHADDPGATTDTQGIMSPRDTILTGTIKRVAAAT